MHCAIIEDVEIPTAQFAGAMWRPVRDARLESQDKVISRGELF
jgi:hypothetical protein